MAKPGPKPRLKEHVSVSMRMDPDIHRQTRQLALNKKTSMNRELQEALERHLADAQRQGQLS